MSDPNTSSTTTLEELEFGLTGSLVRPGEAQWDAARSAWNLAADQHPVAVAFPADADDIALVVEFAAEAGLRVTAQSTGHFALALGDLSDTILVRTTQLTQVALDSATRTVRVGAGAVWGQVNTLLADAGLAALAGSSPDVGVVGYTLGGGISWLSRSRGLAASSVTAVELVLADGELVRADAEQHTDLFWAVRGGGGNFGIVTALEFTVFPLTDVIGGAVLYPIDRAREVLIEYAAWAAQLDNTASTCARILRYPPLPELPDFLRGQSFVGIDGVFDSTDAEAEALLAPLRALGPTVDSFTRLPATDLTAVHMDPLFPVPAIGDGQSISAFDAEVIDALLGSVAGDPSSPLLVVDVRQLGGALATHDPNGGAVDHLEGGYLVWAVGVVPSIDAAPVVADAVASVHQALAPWASAQTYSNYRERGVAPELLWDPATLERLRAIKARYDPENLVQAAHPLE
jgi:FAD/FMN-containing dehydrogenase